jgi:hypothetical protein
MNLTDDPGVFVKIISEWILWKYDGKVWWTGCIWFRISTSGGLL